MTGSRSSPMAAGLSADSGSASPVAPPILSAAVLSCPGGNPSPCVLSVPCADDTDDLDGALSAIGRHDVYRVRSAQAEEDQRASNIGHGRPGRDSELLDGGRVVRIRRKGIGPLRQKQRCADDAAAVENARW